MRTNTGMGEDTLWYRLLVTLERFHVSTRRWNWWRARTSSCNRTVFNQNQIEPTCLLCKTEDETIEHFLLHCTALSSVRQPNIDIIRDSYISLHDHQLTHNSSSLLQTVLDCSAFCQIIPKRNQHVLETIEFHSRRLYHTLHCECYKRLAMVPQRVRKKKTHT